MMWLAAGLVVAMLAYGCLVHNAYRVRLHDQRERYLGLISERDAEIARLLTDLDMTEIERDAMTEKVAELARRGIRIETALLDAERELIELQQVLAVERAGGLPA